MIIRKLLVAAVFAGLVASAAACTDITAPQKTAGTCAVTGGGQTCVD